MHSIEVVSHGIIVCWGCNHNEICISIGAVGIGCSVKLEWFLTQILFDIFILYRRLALINQFNFLGNNVYRRHLMMLTEQCSNTQTDITSTSYGDLYLHFCIFFHCT